MDESPHARSEHVTYERDTHTKWGHKNPGGLWWMALLAVPLLLAALASVVSGPGVESRLGDASATALSGAGLDPAAFSVDFSGRDATLRLADGSAASAADLDAAKAAIAGVDGVRVVDVDPAALAEVDGDGEATEEPAAEETTEPAESPSPEETSAPAAACAPGDVQARIDEVIGEDRLQFGEKSDEVTGTAIDEVNAVAAILTECTDLQVTVTGNTDPNGAAGTLSTRRAKAVKAALAAAGVDKGRISAVANRDSVPIGDNATQTGRDLNRYANIEVN